MATQTARQIIRIDEDLCDGCGQCVTACAEGALALIDGKARLVTESFCDGLGACIGECPQGALTIEMRDADVFDESAAEAQAAHAAHHAAGGDAEAEPESLACGCPGSMVETLRPCGATEVPDGTESAVGIGDRVTPESQLTNWPVQIHLLPIDAPYYAGADLLLAADCVPFAHAGFHEDLLRGRTLAIGCPKLDDAISYIEKLARILGANDIRSLTVAHMEVPCCHGLTHVAAQAVAKSGKQIPVETVVIGRDGTRKS